MQDVIPLAPEVRVPKSRLLIVDDDQGMRENLAELFGSLGYDVRTAANTPEALAVLDEQDVDLLLTDYKMPGPTGVELIEAARKRRPGLQAVLMTAFGDSFTEIESVRRGAVGYLNKPFEADEVVAAELDRLLPSAVLATNTSALSVGEISAATERPERVVGMHFFNPAPVLPLVEVVQAEASSDEAVETAFAFAERIGKRPIRCRDTPGFVVNRILIPLLNDCVRVLDEAGVTPEDLDKAMRFGVNWPIGPCALIDLIGVDIHVHASEARFAALGDVQAGIDDADPSEFRRSGSARRGCLTRFSGGGYGGSAGT